MITPLVMTAFFLLGPDREGGIVWERSFEVAQKKARVANKPLMIDFWAEWCSWCERLDRSTYVDPTVVKLSQQFVPVKVNTEGSLQDAAVALRYNVEDLPTIVFISPAGRVVLRVRGYQGPGQFPMVMVQARTTAAKVMAWETSIDKDPHDSAAMLALASHLFEAESWSESRELLEALIRCDGDRPASERKQARLYLAMVVKAHERDFNRTEALLKDGLAIRPADPMDAKLLYLLAKTYFAWNKLKQAHGALEQLVAEHPDTPHGQKAHELLKELDRHSEPRRR